MNVLKIGLFLAASILRLATECHALGPGCCPTAETKSTKSVLLVAPGTKFVFVLTCPAPEQLRFELQRGESLETMDKNIRRDLFVTGVSVYKRGEKDHPELNRSNMDVRILNTVQPLYEGYAHDSCLYYDPRLNLSIELEKRLRVIKAPPPPPPTEAAGSQTPGKGKGSGRPKVIQGKIVPLKQLPEELAPLGDQGPGASEQGAETEPH